MLNALQPMPPENSAYFHAAYAVALVVYVAYALLLVRRRARARSALDAAQQPGSR